MNIISSAYSTIILIFLALAAGANTKRKDMGKLLQFRPKTVVKSDPTPVPVAPENIPDIESAMSGLRRMFTDEEIAQIHKDLGGDD